MQVRLDLRLYAWYMHGAEGGAATPVAQLAKAAPHQHAAGNDATRGFCPEYRYPTEDHSLVSELTGQKTVLRCALSNARHVT